MVQGQVFLKEMEGGEDGTLFKVYHFNIQKLLQLWQNCAMHLKKKKIFCHHNFREKGHSKLSKNDPENIP